MTAELDYGEILRRLVISDSLVRPPCDLLQLLNCALMTLPDWTEPESYRWLLARPAPHWAWQFLRRNSDYQTEYAAFWRTWQALEEAYGSPPNRDFTAWRADPRYVEVRYEDLVADPAASMRTLCGAIGEDADAEWLASVSRREAREAGDIEAGSPRPDYQGPVSAASVGRWHTGLADAELRDVMRICGGRLRELGYLD